jgi:RNA polymerase-associated protein CTR9
MATMTTTQSSNMNGAVNGNTNGAYKSFRFSDIPRAIDVPLTGDEADGQAVEVALGAQTDDSADLCQLLEGESAAKNLWITISMSFAKENRLDDAIILVQHGLTTTHLKNSSKDKLALLLVLAWLQLLKSRKAPRAPSDSAEPVKTKEVFLQEATTTVNEALRVNPAFPPLLLLRGVLYLLRASLVFSRSTGKEYERTDMLKQALKCFEDAYHMSGNRNMMALMGRARVLFMQAKYGLALTSYQEVLSRMPGLIDPDPRIGIGCCFARLGHPDKALTAWRRALQVNPDSKEANALIAVALLREANKLPAASKEFETLYKQAMTAHAAPAYKRDTSFAFACTVFGTYFLHTKRWPQLEQLARTAIEYSDVNSIISDGWFLLARKAHTLEDLQNANDFYARADAARGGPDRDKGYLPAKFGLVQLQLQRGQELGSAKITLEKLSNTKNADITTLLGCIYAEEMFAGWVPPPQEKPPRGQEPPPPPPPPSKKAIELLESVRKLWKDEKSKFTEDETVLLYLARLYEEEKPDESMKCLLQVEGMQVAKIPIDEMPEWDDNDAIGSAAALRELLSPQLLNNMACLHYGSGKYEVARDMFQIALNACVNLSQKQDAEKLEGGDDAEVDTTDTDALVTTISYNLGRTHEALGNPTEANNVYAGLLLRHKDYTDAIARQAFMSLEASPRDEGPKKIAAVFNDDPEHLEVRALMGWYLHGSKRRTTDLSQDTEYRHYKHTLQKFDKHDLYALTAAGNVHLSIARDMPRNTEPEREKRSRMYAKSIEFLEKAVELDPKNAYGAQGIAIALCDDKKNYSDALQILTKVKDAIREPSVFTNLGHVLTELRQYQRGIDNYEIALKKEGRPDNTPLLACLSRAWLLKGKADKSITSHNTALEYMENALATQPENPHLKFNVAFIHFQIATLINGTKESDRTLEDVEAAINGLESAITAFDEVAQHKNPPYPKAALEQRSTMGRNTIRRQLATAKTNQEKYERENASKLKEARERRAAETKRREEEKERKLEEERLQQERIQQERDRMIEETEKLALELRAEAMAREAAEWTDDSSGERVKRSTIKKKKGAAGAGKKGRKRERDDEDGFIEDDDDGLSERSVSRTPMSGEDSGAEQRAADGEEKPKKKRRKLERRGGKEKKSKAAPKASKKSSKFKSAEKVVDSSDEDEGSAVATPDTPAGGDESEPVVDTPRSDEDEEMRDRAPTPVGGDDADDEEVVAKPVRKRKQLRTIADDDEDEDEIPDADLARRALAAVEDE